VFVSNNFFQSSPIIANSEGYDNHETRLKEGEKFYDIVDSVNAQLGGAALLPCVVRQAGKNSVSAGNTT
jgi:hypothetical protein